MWFLSPVLLPLGLFLPGFFLARALRLRMKLAAALPLSLLVLFHCVFWLGVFHVPITLWTGLGALLPATGAAFWLASRRLPGKTPERDAASWKALPQKPASRKAITQKGVPQKAAPLEKEPARSLDRLDFAMLIGAAFVCAVLLARTAISPSLGPDTTFRWDFLARQILDQRSFHFYPPLTPADFSVYFYPDGIPPLIPFANWWIYAAVGRYLPPLTSLFIAAQFACTLALVYGTAAALWSRRAGVLAAALLAGCPLYFNSVALGQETGLTALSLIAMLYSLVAETAPESWYASAAGGLMAALCALSREYGWAAAAVGIAVLLWRRRPVKSVGVFAGVAIAAASPWYVRNWIVAGNPLYSLRFLGFHVNPIHDAILQYYRHTLTPLEWTPSALGAVALSLLFMAPAQVFAGIPGAAGRLRNYGYLGLAAVVFVAIWIQSTGYTSGGMGYSLRVLSPVWAVLSLAAAAMLVSLTRNARLALVAVIVGLECWTACYGILYPADPRTLPLDKWAGQAFRTVPSGTDFQIRDQLAAMLRPGAKILSDSAYLHAAMIDKGVTVVPVWSPEVRFLFSAAPADADRALAALGISSVAVYPRSLNTDYLRAASPFYATVADRWKVRAQVPGVVYILGPK